MGQSSKSFNRSILLISAFLQETTLRDVLSQAVNTRFAVDVSNLAYSKLSLFAEGMVDGDWQAVDTAVEEACAALAAALFGASLVVTFDVRRVLAKDANDKRCHECEAAAMELVTQKRHPNTLVAELSDLARKSEGACAASPSHQSAPLASGSNAQESASCQGKLAMTSGEPWGALARWRHLLQLGWTVSRSSASHFNPLSREQHEELCRGIGPGDDPAYCEALKALHRAAEEKMEADPSL